LGKVEAAVTAKGSGESNKDSKGGQNQRQEDETFKLLIKASLREEFENFTRNNPTLLTTGVPQTPQGNRPWGGAAQPTAQTVPPVPTPPVPKPQAEHARQSYLGLLNNQLIGSEPIHLDSEGTSSVFGKLEDSNIYLQQVGHSQGTFVLFTEDNRTGYVFPNPALAYQEKALREVFRGLTEAEFNGAKQRIEPVPVTRVGDRRWRIGEAASP
jgi:hypothetical protein